MKRKIMVAATGLSAGTLVAVSVVNPKIVSDLVRVELVKAEETENLKDITEIMPDPALRRYIADLVRIEEQNNDDELTFEELENANLDSLALLTKDFYSLKGIEYVGSLNGLEIGFDTLIKDISMLKKVRGLTILNLQTNKIVDFSVLADLFEKSEFQLFVGIDNDGYVPSKTIINDIAYLNADDSVLNLTSYIGNLDENLITIDEIIINENVIDDEEEIHNLYNPTERIIELSDVINTNKSHNGTITINLLQNLPYLMNDGEAVTVKTTIIQPYEVKIPTSGSGNETSNIEEIKEKNIMTDRKELTIYNQYGKKTGTKNLTEEITDFTTNRVNEVNSVKYYEIGDNEWVEADKVKEFYFNDSYIQTHASSFKELTKLDSNPVTDRVLAKNSDWYSDRYVYLDDKLHYRVSTHEWVRDGHVVQYESVNGIVHATETASLYNSEGEKVTDRALAKGSTFFADKKATIDGKLMYRVATDEWVDADTVIFK
ncbi:SLAP domain-containing protein [Companilactobacillus muriivasis]|uniref:SLAP domain-containing protein n=1 Tax=Companilactobacillus muriivasis TaxID=3081444 RepID=UPI0030C6CB8E